jgi:hypothetical protein
MLEEFVQQQNRSWLALITFCATTALIAALGFAVLFASATVAFAVAQSLKSSAPDHAATGESGKTFSGMITDSNCGPRHAKNSGKSPAECARLCVRKGAKYTLVDGDKNYALAGNEAELDKLAGQRVTLEGALEGDTLNVTAVTPQ